MAFFQALKSGLRWLLWIFKKISLCLKCSKWDTLELKINIFEVVSKSAYWIFLKLYLLKYIENWEKVTVFNFYRIFFSKSCSLGFYEIMPVLKNGYRWLFRMLKENSSYAQNGLNKSNVRTLGPYLFHTYYFQRKKKLNYNNHHLFSI